MIHQHGGTDEIFYVKEQKKDKNRDKTIKIKEEEVRDWIETTKTNHNQQ